MRILIDARFYGIENAGLGRYTINLLNELQKLDKVHEYTILLRKKYFDELKLADNFHKVLADISHYSLKEQIEIPKIIDKHNPDLVHFLHFNVPMNFKRNFLVTIHDMTMHRKNLSATNLFLPVYYAKRFLYKQVFASAVKNSVKIITPSQFVKDELIKNFKIKSEKVKVIYEGVNNLKSKFSPIRQNQLYFLYVGNAYPHKNLEFAIKAITELNKHTNQKIYFYIITKEGKFRDKLQKLVSKLGAQDFVKFYDAVSDENLQNLYQRAVGFIYPSLSEGFGLQGLEAMKSGTLLLASLIPTFKEIYGNHAVYFDPNDQKTLISAMNKVLSFSKLEAEQIIRDNRRFVTRYSWEKMAKETIETYNSVK